MDYVVQGILYFLLIVKANHLICFLYVPAMFCLVFPITKEHLKERRA